jgi:hypothetical protein
MMTDDSAATTPAVAAAAAADTQSQSQSLAPASPAALIGLPGPLTPGPGANFSDALSEARLERLRNDLNEKTSDGSFSLPISPSLTNTKSLWKLLSNYGVEWPHSSEVYYIFDSTRLDSTRFGYVPILFMIYFSVHSTGSHNNILATRFVI